MTAPIIKSKKCKFLPMAALFASLAMPAAGAPLPKLPVIQNVGVVPVQWEGSANSLGENKTTLDQSFSKVVRDSHRFRVLSDDLVSSLWKDANGRTELRDEFELHGLIGLTVTQRGDVIQLTARLMDGWLKTNLIETDTITTSWLQHATAPSIDDRIQRLVYRLFNRLPVDVSITSVQGPYVTLSGGSEQGIEIGDSVSVIRAQVSSLHPATGAWHEFAKMPLGSAKVIEVKSFTAVAKITDQVRDGAIEIGDGARIAAISSRVKFARLAQADEFKDSGNQETIVVPPLYQGAAPSPDRPITTKPAPTALPVKPGLFDPPPAPTKTEVAQSDGSGDKESNDPEINTADTGEQNNESAEKSEQAEQTEQPEQEEVSPEYQGPSVWDRFANEATSHSLIEEIVGYAGPRWWSVKGPVNSSGKFPIWLLNSVGAGVSRTMFYNIKGAFGGGVMFGSTPSSSYFGFEGYGRGYWEENLLLANGIVKHWRLGGAATYQSISVGSGNFGGGDWIRAGFYAGLDGSLTADARYDWFADFTLMPLNIGRIGYSSSYKSVESSLGTSLALGAYRFDQPRTIQWGGGIELKDERQTLKNGRRPHLTDYSIKLLAKYSM